MSRTIQEALDLPTLEDLLKAPRETDDHDSLTEDELLEAEGNADVDALTAALESPITVRQDPDVVEAKDHADSADDIYGQTLQHAQDLMDLGYNVDTRSAGRIFETAAGMYKLALDAKNSKRDAQLKAQKLKLENEKLKALLRQKSGEGNEIIEQEAVIIADRNDLIKKIRGQ
jgi:hypothetical protein